MYNTLVQILVLHCSLPATMILSFEKYTEYTIKTNGLHKPSDEHTANQTVDCTQRRRQKWCGLTDIINTMFQNLNYLCAKLTLKLVLKFTQYFSRHGSLAEPAGGVYCRQALLLVTTVSKMFFKYLKVLWMTSPFQNLSSCKLASRSAFRRRYRAWSQITELCSTHSCMSLRRQSITFSYYLGLKASATSTANPRIPSIPIHPIL